MIYDTEKRTSFIIPHKGRTEMLEATVASIQNQSHFAWVDEIIIVTLNQQPLTLRDNDKVRIIHLTYSPSISFQRNKGAACCQSPYLAFLDADIELSPDWLALCHHQLADHEPRLMISAMQGCKNPKNPLERVRSALSNAYLDANLSFLPGRNLLLSRDTFLTAGQFPEHLQTCEDYYFTERVSALGELYYTSRTWYYHLGEDADYRETFQKERWRSAYNLASLKGRDIPLGEWPSILLPFWFLLAGVILLLGIMSANLAQAFTGLLMWCLPIFIYSARLYYKNNRLIPFMDIAKFYAAYFPGRAIGTFVGIPNLFKHQPRRSADRLPENAQGNHPLRVLEFICPAGFYGAERWIIALAKGCQAFPQISCELAVTKEGSAPLEVCQHFENMGLQTHEIPLSNRFDLSAITKLTKLIETQQIDIIHTHGYKSDIIGLLAARRAGIPAVCTPHGFENARDWKLKLYLWLGGLTFRHFSKVSPLSPQIAQDLRTQYRVPEEKIYPILNGVDLTEVAQIRDTINKETNECFVVGYIGQLISRKNVDDLLRAFAIFVGERPKSELHLIGDGEEKEHLQKLASDLGVTEKVKFMGFRDDRLLCLRQFDVFAMTSSLEGIPRCLMESMAMEVPMTAFNIPGVDQVIRHGKSGLSCSFGDCSGLARLWMQIQDNPDTMRALVKKARVVVDTEFSAQRMAREYITLFEALTGHAASDATTAHTTSQDHTLPESPRPESTKPGTV
jgi:glycosyltransferase involved in cell wall biosynthesis